VLLLLSLIGRRRDPDLSDEPDITNERSGSASALKRRETRGNKRTGHSLVKIEPPSRFFPFPSPFRSISRNRPAPLPPHPRDPTRLRIRRTEPKQSPSSSSICTPDSVRRERVGREGGSASTVDRPEGRVGEKGVRRGVRGEERSRGDGFVDGRGEVGVKGGVYVTRRLLVRLLWVDVLRGVGLWLLLVSGLLSVLWVMGLVRVLPLMLGEEDRLMHRLSTLLLSRRQLEGRGREMTRGLAHGDVVPVVLHMTMRFVALLIKQVTFFSFGCALWKRASQERREE
jgi:hypothetical protein